MYFFPALVYMIFVKQVIFFEPIFHIFEDFFFLSQWLHIVRIHFHQLEALWLKFFGIFKFISLFSLDLRIIFNLSLNTATNTWSLWAILPTFTLYLFIASYFLRTSMRVLWACSAIKSVDSGGSVRILSLSWIRNLISLFLKMLN